MVSRLLTLLFITIFSGHTSFAQCPGAANCSHAVTLCSAAHLDGLSCTTSANSNTSFPLPSLCFGTGQPQNIQWWSFVGNGGILTLKFNFDRLQCSQQRGIQAGWLEGGCDGFNIASCNASCTGTSFSLTSATSKCEVYYIWVDGCQGDICPFTIEVSGSSGAPTLPVILPLQTRDEVCICGKIEVCAPDFGECFPTLQWQINGGAKFHGDDCVTADVPENATPGDKVTICLTATIGNPDIPHLICDQKMRCTDFIVESIKQKFETCEVVCHEDQPAFWHGNQISSSCIVPPCKARVQESSGCCVDAFKVFVLPSSHQVGIKDTFMCDSQPYLAENNWPYTGEVCLELVEFQTRLLLPECPTSSERCDTSYELVIARLSYTTDWETKCDSSLNQLQLYANVEHETECAEFLNQVDISLEWFDETSGTILDTTSGTEPILVNIPGTYCVYVSGLYNGMSCTAPKAECFEVTEEMLHQTATIDGDSKICFDTTSEYSIQADSTILVLDWMVKGQGKVIGSADSTSVMIQWDSLQLDTTQVCANIKTKCSEYEICKEVLICPETTSNDDYSEGKIYYSFSTKQLFWKQLNGSWNQNKLSIYNIQGQLLKTEQIHNEGTMDLSGVPNGIYFIQLSISHIKSKVLKVSI